MCLILLFTRFYCLKQLGERGKGVVTQMFYQLLLLYIYLCRCDLQCHNIFKCGRIKHTFRNTGAVSVLRQAASGHIESGSPAPTLHATLSPQTVIARQRRCFYQKPRTALQPRPVILMTSSCF